jgi:hypothetical protein
VGGAEEEPGGVQVAGPGGVDDARYRLGRDAVGVVAHQHHRPLLAPCEHGDLAAPAYGALGLCEVLDLVERADLLLVGEQDVDVVLDELAEFVAVTLDAERVRKRE